MKLKIFLLVLVAMFIFTYACGPKVNRRKLLH